MPIDFNPHFMFNTNRTIQPKAVQNQIYAANREIKEDTFTKSISFQSASIDSNYDGIKINKKSFGTIKKTNEEAQLYTITNKNGASVDLSTFGATITSIKVPDKEGKLKDVTQGYDNVTPYEESPVGHAGGTIGPYANKISNGKFIINDKEYQLECNKDNGTTHSHGGTEGFDVKNWQANVLPDGIEFTYIKKDMESGYPGNVKASVTYKFDNNNNLHIQYKAKSDTDTIINMTNHTYFNLDGAENAQENSVLEHIVTLPNSSTITKNSEIAIPTGEIIPVENTPFDFKQPQKIKDVINIESDQLKIGSGFDQNYCIDNYDGKTLIEVANVKSEKTGINLKVLTNLPGFQFYSANHLGKAAQPNGKHGFRYEKRSSFCIEPQFYPNAINTETFTEKGILKKDETYNREIIYSFATVD
uniref:Aldose 1-epimerase n=1 Tax=uncultured Candidatus Melainabacteria bacterium TaxID=2682970 RepID=A0A650EJC9_9BACT|nr:aldose 1-epimerase [uncultured Candidatus Melainabacteria bacterium]